MPTLDPSNLNKAFAAFLAGDCRAGEIVYAQMRGAILATVRKRAPDLVNDGEDVLDEVFVLMLEAPHRFDPARASASTFIALVLVPDAIQRVRAKMARPGTTTRRRKVTEPVAEASFPMPDPLPAPETVAVIGYGSQAAMEAACDAHGLYARASTQLRVIIGGLLDGKSRTEVAAEMQIDRIKVVRMIKAVKDLAGAA